MGHKTSYDFAQLPRGLKDSLRAHFEAVTVLFMILKPCVFIIFPSEDICNNRWQIYIDHIDKKIGLYYYCSSVNISQYYQPIYWSGPNDNKIRMYSTCSVKASQSLILHKEVVMQQLQIDWHYYFNTEHDVRFSLFWSNHSREVSQHVITDNITRSALILYPNLSYVVPFLPSFVLPFIRWLYFNIKLWNVIQKCF